MAQYIKLSWTWYRKVNWAPYTEVASAQEVEEISSQYMEVTWTEFIGDLNSAEVLSRLAAGKLHQS